MAMVAARYSRFPVFHHACTLPQHTALTRQYSTAAGRGHRVAAIRRCRPGPLAGRHSAPPGRPGERPVLARLPAWAPGYRPAGRCPTEEIRKHPPTSAPAPMRPARPPRLSPPTPLPPRDRWRTPGSGGVRRRTTGWYSTIVNAPPRRREKAPPHPAEPGCPSQKPRRIRGPGLQMSAGPHGSAQGR